MHFTQSCIANLTHFAAKIQDYMTAVRYEFVHARDIGIIAMTVQKFNAPAAPNTVLVSVLSEIVAPVANVFASALITLFNRLAKWRESKPAQAVAFPAPHVAMVMVPGKFVTEPFTRHQR